jgi:hypothetical protein
MEADANARNSIALAHVHSASLHCRGRRLVHGHAAACSLEGIRRLDIVYADNRESSLQLVCGGGKVRRDDIRNIDYCIVDLD